MMRRASTLRLRAAARAAAGATLLASLAMILGPGMGVAASRGAAAPAVAADDSALAVYDGGAVYPHDFNAAWWMLSPPQRPKGDAVTSRQRFLASVVDRRLLAEAALKQHYPLTPEQATEIQRTRDLMAQNALFDEMVRDIPPPTDADVERFRRQKIELAEIKFVTFPDGARAQSWRSRLAMGTPFKALETAIAHEGPTLATADTFRLVAAEQIPDTLATLIWSMRPGQVNLIENSDGHATLILLRSFARRPATAAGENIAIKTELQGRQWARAREAYRAELAQKAGRTFDEKNIDFLLARHLQIRPRSDVDSVTGQPIIRPNLPLPYVTGADTARVLARTGSETVTIADYLRYWAQTQPMARPEIRERGSLEGAVDRIALAPALIAEAKRRGLGQAAEVEEALANMREGYAVERFYHEMFEARVKATDAALRKYYDADPTHYDDRASISPRLLIVDHRSLADSLKAQIAQGASFPELARQYSLDSQTAEQGGLAKDILRRSQDNGGLEDAMFATPVGKLGGPEQTPQGWVIWRIESATPGVKRTFADARPMVDRDFRIVEADRLLSEYLETEKARRHVHYFDDRVTAQLGRGGPWE